MQCPFCANEGNRVIDSRLARDGSELLLPVAAAYDLDPVHLGIIFLAAMQLGYLTPPVGLNLFIASYRFNQTITRIYAATLPFLLILLVAVIIITFWPGLSLALLGR